MTRAASSVKSKYIKKYKDIYKKASIMQSCKGKLLHSITQK